MRLDLAKQRNTRTGQTSYLEDLEIKQDDILGELVRTASRNKE